MKQIKLLLIFLLSGSLVFAQTAKRFTSPSGRFTYNYLVYEPANIQPGVKKPVVVFIPGLGEVGTDINKLYVNGPMKFIKEGWKPDFIVYAFQPDAGWANYQHVQFFLGEVNKNTNVNQSAIFLTGLSAGANAIFDYIQRTADKDFIEPAAIVPMSIAWNAQSGDYYKNTDALAGTDFRYKDIPVWGLGGSTDNSHTDKIKRFVQRLTEAGFDAKFTTYIGGHGGWNTFYNPTWKENGESIYDWMLKHTSAAPVVVPPASVPTPSKKLLFTLKVYDDGTTEIIK